ncbi:N-acetylmuramoyl-L-alanine amidase AmiA [Izhakiella capsodis]|uniref:N-acetylmuramoyl-L-alanine amidase AmiA n=1 Tax=Izhakiella capsodis TaxID=1367852 RepID=UPI001E5B81DF|nr:N-acetylmuramoyl-L-alanine amidase AmiA [Izhakiella capsodis]
MKPIKSLTPLVSRRQLLLCGLALALTGTKSVFAAAEGSRPRLSGYHNYPKRTVPGRKRIVMIDPGHGGIDPGAIGEEGSEEKHVVLEIARYVRMLLQHHPTIEAMLTRDSDHFIPLYERVEIAHRHGANLFMSIHADGFTSPIAHGASVFALSTRGASSTMAKYLANRENSADRFGGAQVEAKDRYLQEIIFDLVQTNTIKKSLTLGKHVLNQIRPIHHLHSQHTEQAAFAVLKSPSIPSVLVETSFITNPQEERLLDTSVFRQKIAGAIVDGIIGFFNEVDGVHRR